MIAIDTSAIIAILMMEPEAERFLHMMASRRVLVGAPTLFEAHMVLEGHLSGRAKEVLRLFLAEGLVTVVPFDGVMSELAFDAFLRFGKGRGHAAKLTFGDCQSYAVSRAHDAPLLFKGDDFVHTDVSPAYRPAP